ncbi:hypothetical protein H6G41_05135 [Tolypothrix sp. FACHB-123]|uniref:hypothetical protein n=1 Tax=Tolypothrix sp. FACHB-123 TaxID=2692868 RepID=UPI0016862752|nr:hypothetical protein [Tolypothrix sp. FACHB-123]MBD2354009.1 hypothetical protein [Tolypothrix sp. FACHB-123]
MVNYQRDRILPTSAELPCSDDTPVDNVDQNFIPNLLSSLNSILLKITLLRLLCGSLP